MDIDQAFKLAMLKAVERDPGLHADRWQTQLAEYTGVKRPQINYIKNGKRKASAFNLWAISKYFGYSPEGLMCAMGIDIYKELKVKPPKIKK